MMSLSKAGEKNFKGGDQNFPILYQDDVRLVYMNPTKEIFVEDRNSGVTMRINLAPATGLQFTTSSRVEPVIVNNMIGWRIGPG